MFSYLWLVGNGRMVVIVVIIVPPFLHSLQTKGKFLLLLVLCLLLMSAAATGASNHRNHNKKKAKQQQQQQAVRIAGSTSVEVRQEGKFLAIGTWWCKMLAQARTRNVAMGSIQRAELQILQPRRHPNSLLKSTTFTKWRGPPRLH